MQLKKILYIELIWVITFVPKITSLYKLVYEIDGLACYFNYI
jgi:hypothetical protein